MNLSISLSSLTLPNIIPQRCKAASHDNWALSTTPTNKNIKSTSLVSSNCSTNKLISPVPPYGESKLSKTLLYGQNRGNILRVRAQAESAETAESNGTIAKVRRFGSACYKFLRPYALSHTIVSCIGLYGRVLVENPHAFTWYHLVFKAIPGFIAMTLANAYYYGVNQIFDIQIDRVNKPYLPLPAGELSLTQAWFLVVLDLLSGLLIFWLTKADLITTSVYVAGLFLGHFYSAPPFRFKQSSFATSIVNPVNAGILHNLGVLYATRTSLGLPFLLSPAYIFISVFITIYFLALTNLKDVTDMEGDLKHNIRTLPTIYGPRKTTLFFVGLLLASFTSSAVLSIFMPQAFKPLIMVPAHAIFASLIFFKTWQLDKANYTREAFGDFYMTIWKILLAEFFFFPFI